MIMIERLEDTGLQDLSQRTDLLGVLSVYVNADASQDTNLRVTAIDLKNRFHEFATPAEPERRFCARQRSRFRAGTTLAAHRGPN
jgi:hypothetical protein